MDFNKIITGNSLDVMKSFEDKCIDLTVTSPPYDNLRNYNGYTFDFENIAKELYRITKDGGVVVWIVNDAVYKGSETLTSFKQAIYFKEIGFNVHDTMFFMKKNPFGGSGNGHMRYRQAIEYMFVLSKGKPKTFNPFTEPCVKAGKIATGGTRKNRQSDGLDFDAKRNISVEINKTKILRNVWEYHTGYMHTSKDKIVYEHPAPFPEKLAEDHILSWSNEGEVVLDIFGGSGTTAKMALLNNRKFIHIDISEEYNNIAREKMKNLL